MRTKQHLGRHSRRCCQSEVKRAVAVKEGLRARQPTGSALGNNCPAWIQHVADAAPVLLCHSYELSGGVGCRFAGYRSQVGAPPLDEDSDLTESVVTFDWHLSALQCSHQAAPL